MALITISKFAEKHGVRRQTVYKAVKERRLKAKKICGVMFIESRQKYEPNAA